MSSKRKRPASRSKKTPPPTSTTLHVPSKLVPKWMHRERTRVLTPETTEMSKDGKCVIYWMQRDMRTSDNWALLYASHLSRSCDLPLRVVYVPPRPEVLPQPWTARYFKFLLEGLKEVERELRKDYCVPFDVIYPAEDNDVANSFLTAFGMPAAVVCDMSPLRHNRLEKEEVARQLENENVPLYQVDAHNIIPVWHASDKREVGARTLRKKIDRLLPDFMTHFPALEVDESVNNKDSLEMKKPNWKTLHEFLQTDDTVAPLQSPYCGGTTAGMKQFQSFLTTGLAKYDKLRNDPNCPNNTSHISPWVNFGHVSFQRLAITIRALDKYPSATAGFIEEGVVRRELSDNFLFYTEEYDSIEGAAAGWARESLELHSSDDREWVYDKEELEGGKTHDDLWNASQMQLVAEGKLHGFLRMYWAKKILEWTPSPQKALSYAQYFNDKYALDGNDPNGYVGVGWSIMGIHDMGWKERPIFGKIRFMNYNGCKRKFKVDHFVGKYPGAKETAMKVMGRKSQGSITDGAAGKKRKRAVE